MIHTFDQNVEKLMCIMDAIKHVSRLAPSMSKKSLEMELQCLDDLANQGQKTLEEINHEIRERLQDTET